MLSFSEFSNIALQRLIVKVILDDVLDYIVRELRAVLF